ncbi:MAG TPA: MFS transporter [Dehalococcoidia bacterium]|nr:MFS transporter [Dehalococcoidia bacterium]
MLVTIIAMSNNIITSFRRWDYVKISIFSLAITALWQSMHWIILQMRLQEFVPETQKNTYLGLMTLSGLLLAMLAQPIAGAISDRSSFRWGQRRPFIIIGTIATLCFLPGVGLAGSFATLFVVYCLLNIATNTAQGPFQAFIPDLVPRNKYGLASGVKALLEVIGAVVFVFITGELMDRYSTGDESLWLWLVILILGVTMLGAMLATALTVKEKPGVPIGRARSALKALWETVKEVTAKSEMKWFLVSRALIYMAFTTIQTWALYYLEDVIGVETPAGSTAEFAIFGVIGMLAVAWPAGYLSDKIGRKPIIITAGLLGGLGIGIIYLSQQYNTILWASGLIGIGLGAFNSANWALATDLVEKGEEARYLGIANIATTGGAALARAIGPAVDHFNSLSVNSGYDFVLLMCVIYFIVGSLLVLKIRKKTSPSRG